MFVKDTLEKEVSVVVKLRGAIWGYLYPAIQRQTETIIYQEALDQCVTNVWSCLHLQGEQVFLRELQVIVVTKPPQHSPGGLVSTSLYEEGVQEQKPCDKKQMTGEWTRSVISMY